MLYTCRESNQDSYVDISCLATSCHANSENNQPLHQSPHQPLHKPLHPDRHLLSGDEVCIPMHSMRGCPLENSTTDINSTTVTTNTSSIVPTTTTTTTSDTGLNFLQEEKQVAQCVTTTYLHDSSTSPTTHHHYNGNHHYHQHPLLLNDNHPCPTPRETLHSDIPSTAPRLPTPSSSVTPPIHQYRTRTFTLNRTLDDSSVNVSLLPISDHAPCSNIVQDPTTHCLPASTMLKCERSVFDYDSTLCLSEPYTMVHSLDDRSTHLDTPLVTPLATPLADFYPADHDDSYLSDISECTEPQDLSLDHSADAHHHHDDVVPPVVSATVDIALPSNNDDDSICAAHSTAVVDVLDFAGEFRPRAGSSSTPSRRQPNADSAASSSTGDPLASQLGNSRGGGDGHGSQDLQGEPMATNCNRLQSDEGQSYRQQPVNIQLASTATSNITTANGTTTISTVSTAPTTYATPNTVTSPLPPLYTPAKNHRHPLFKQSTQDLVEANYPRSSVRPPLLSQTTLDLVECNSPRGEFNARPDSSPLEPSSPTATPVDHGECINHPCPVSLSQTHHNHHKGVQPAVSQTRDTMSIDHSILITSRRNLLVSQDTFDLVFNNTLDDESSPATTPILTPAPTATLPLIHADPPDDTATSSPADTAVPTDDLLASVVPQGQATVAPSQVVQLSTADVVQANRDPLQHQFLASNGTRARFNSPAASPATHHLLSTHVVDCSEMNNNHNKKVDFSGKDVNFSDKDVDFSGKDVDISDKGTLRENSTASRIRIVITPQDEGHALSDQVQKEEDDGKQEKHNAEDHFLDHSNAGIPLSEGVVVDAEFSDLADSNQDFNSHLVTEDSKITRETLSGGRTPEILQDDHEEQSKVEADRKMVSLANESNTSSLMMLSISHVDTPHKNHHNTRDVLQASISELDRQSDADSVNSLHHNKTMSTCSTESIDTAFKTHTGSSQPPTTSTAAPVNTAAPTTTITAPSSNLSHLMPHGRTLSSKTTNLLSPFSVSTESMLSVYSMGGEGANYGKFPITGDVYLTMNYDYRKETFEVEVKKCRELAIADPKRKKTDSYVKLYLLPDRTRTGKRKTSTKKNSSNPTFDETVKYKISKSELENRALWISVWHSDSFGRNEFLGETTLDSDVLIADESSIPTWYPLQDKFQNSVSPKIYKGDLEVAIRIVAGEKNSSSAKKLKVKSNGTITGNRLEVKIIRAKNLTAMRSNGTSDPFVKGYLLPNRRRKQKTSVKRKDCNPEWGDKDLFTFELLSEGDDNMVEEIKSRSLELTIWDYDRLTSNDFLGGVRLNLGEGLAAGQKVDWMDSRDQEVEIWQQLVNSPLGAWLSISLPLRDSMHAKLSLF